MSGYVEISVATGEKRLHTLESMTRRIAAVQRGVSAPKSMAHVDEQINDVGFVEIGCSWMRRFSPSLGDTDSIPYAMETGAWGHVEALNV